MDKEKTQEIENRSKISLEELVESRMNGKNDPFWSNLVIKYFKEELKMNDNVAKRIFADLAKYDDILNEFATYLLKRTYDIPNAIIVNDYTAKQIHELNPKFEACGVYTFLRLIRDKRLEAERIIASGFMDKDTKIPKVNPEEIKKKIDNRLKELENEEKMVDSPKSKPKVQSQTKKESGYGDASKVEQWLKNKEEYDKKSFKELVESRMDGKNDPFWSNLVITYFKKYLKMDDNVAKRIFADLAKYDDILNEFTKFLTQKTYDIPNAIIVNDYTAKQIHELNPKFEAHEVYNFLKLIRDYRELAEKMIASGFIEEYPKFSTTNIEELKNEIDNRIAELEKEEQKEKKIQTINCICGKSFNFDWTEIPNTQATVWRTCPHCNNMIEIENPYFDKALHQQKIEQIQKANEHHRKQKETFKTYVKNKFNSNLIQDDKQIDIVKKELSTCKEGLDYICGSNIPNKQTNFEQITITPNHIYFNIDNEIKVILDDSEKCKKVIDYIKRELKPIKENSGKKLSSIKSSSKCEMHIKIDNEYYNLNKLVNDESSKRLFDYLLSDIKKIVFYDKTPMSAQDWKDIDKTIDELFTPNANDIYWATCVKTYMRTLKMSHEDVEWYKSMLVTISKYNDTTSEFTKCLSNKKYLDNGLVIEELTAKDIYSLTHLPVISVYNLFTLLRHNPTKTKELLKNKYNFKG